MAKPELDGPRKNADETTGKKMPVGHRFQPGNPGRPKGSRNKLGEDFIAALHEDFQAHGPQVIAAVRESKPEVYMKVVASILPKEVRVSDTSELTDDEVNQRIRQLADILDLALGDEGRVDRASRGEKAPVRSH